MNPRIRKIARNILFLMSVPVVMGAFVFAQKSTEKDVCQDIKVSIANPEFSFITQDDIHQAISGLNILPDQTLINQIPLQQLEQELEENHWVASASLYISAGGVLNVHVVQKKPVVRIQQKDSSDYTYFLDETANPVPVSTKYFPRVPVVTCGALSYTRSDLALKSDLVKLSQYISNDTFLNAAITQINLNDKQEIELVPAFGNQLILFGTTEDMKDKFDRLFAFYRHTLEEYDLSKYDEIDLRFKGQVVGRNTHGRILSESPYAEKKSITPVMPAAKTPSPLASKLQATSKAPTSVKATPKKEPVNNKKSNQVSAKPAEKKPAPIIIKNNQ